MAKHNKRQPFEGLHSYADQRRKRGRQRAHRQPRELATPTPERLQHDAFQRAGIAYRVKPPIVCLHDAGKLSDAQFAALHRFAEVGSKAGFDRSRSCLDHSPRGGGDIAPSVLRARIEYGQMERALGSLADIADAVCIEGLSLTAWCIRTHGAVQRADGRVDARKRDVALALLELQMAAARLMGDEAACA